MQKQLSSEELFQGKLVNLHVQTIPQPDGGTKRFEIVEHPDVVVVVALRYDDSVNETNAVPYVVLVNQERPAIQKKMWELPAGLVEVNERNTPEIAAARELREETGYLADKWRFLTREYPSPGFSTEAITIYLATQVHPAPDAAIPDIPSDPTEIVQVRWIPLDEALTCCQNGEIEDGKTLLGLNLVQNMLMSEKTATGGHTMPRDLTNMPFPRSATYRSNNTTESEVESNDKLNTTLNIENMLLEEFNYASVTAYQAMEDRARMFNLYLLLVGVLASGLGAVYQLGGRTSTYEQPLVSALLLIAGMIGVAFFVKLIRLRQAWRESVISMNAVKEFYIQQFRQQMPRIERAFRWRLKTIPAGERLGSTTFIVCFTVALLESVCFGGALFLSINNIPLFSGQVYPYIIAVVIFACILLLNVMYYRHSLNVHSELAAIEEQAKEIGE
ncbi:MAG TPA: NUDIX hydrolase [Ktedonobacteraceae bacterium]|nr:NUDIX hydrolase [Ktedonobacteraceae bacterium]